MSDRGMLFTAETVRALVAGIKTQTRRELKAPRWAEAGCEVEIDGSGAPVVGARASGCLATVACPYGGAGDRLWVKETWGEYIQTLSDAREDRWYVYRADQKDAPSDNGGQRPWRNAMFMPRHASRILLEITAVRAERLHEISGADAAEEGCVDLGEDRVRAQPHIPGFRRDARNLESRLRYQYAVLWETINGQGSWAANPLVWVITFARWEAATTLESTLAATHPPQAPSGA